MKSMFSSNAVVEAFKKCLTLVSIPGSDAPVESVLGVDPLPREGVEVFAVVYYPTSEDKTDIAFISRANADDDVIKANRRREAFDNFVNAMQDEINNS